MEKDVKKRRENFRGSLHKRFKSLHGAIGFAAKMAGKSGRTGTGWFSEGYPSMPDAHVLYATAMHFGVSPAWLAFGEGPSPEEQRWLDAMKSLSPEHRSAVLALIERLRGGSGEDLGRTAGGAGLVSAPYLMDDYSSPDRVAEDPPDYGLADKDK